MAIGFLILLYIGGVIASVAWAHQQGKNVLFWFAVALFLSPMIALIGLSFSGLGVALQDSSGCAKAGFLGYRPD